MDISRHSLCLGFFTLLFRLYGTELYGILRANLMTAKASDALCIVQPCNFFMYRDSASGADLFTVPAADALVRNNGALPGRLFAG